MEEYEYWPDGTRSYEMNSLRGISGRTFGYDDENHLLSAGGTTYLYDVDGFLTDKIQGSDTTEYVYSSRGELLGVELPDGTVIEYVHDPLERRIAKKVDGVIVEKYLWQGMTRLLAVFDGAGALLMRFEYADERMPVCHDRRRRPLLPGLRPGGVPDRGCGCRRRSGKESRVRQLREHYLRQQPGLRGALRICRRAITTTTPGFCGSATGTTTRR